MTIATVFAVENLFSVTQFPGHTISAEEAADGYAADKVANGRRSAQDYWTPTTANSATWIKATCDTVRAANYIALDRGHNLAGKTVALEVSSDDFTTYETVFSVVLPSATAPGALDDALGVRTEEGAWLKRFDVRAGTGWRLSIAAMGAGLKPQVVGLWVGLCWQPTRGLTLPVAPGRGESVAELVESLMGWQGRGRTTRRQTGTLTLKLDSEIEAEVAEYHLEGHFAANRPLWLVYDQRRADKARLVLPAAEPFGGEYLDDWINKQTLRLSYVEHEATAA